MNKLKVIGILLLISTSLIGQDYKPYRNEVNSDGFNNKYQQDNSADGFFDNYVNLYNGDPNEGSMKKNKEIKEQQQKLLREKEAILNSLDSMSIENKKEEMRISDMKAKVAKENAIKGNRPGSSYNSRPAQQNSRSSQRNDNYDVVYEYERKIVRRPN